MLEYSYNTSTLYHVYMWCIHSNKSTVQSHAGDSDNHTYRFSMALFSSVMARVNNKEGKRVSNALYTPCNMPVFGK